MKKLFKIPKNINIQVSSHIAEFLSPKKIFLPFNNQNLILQSRIVKKGDLIIESEFLYAPVSGKITNVTTINNKNYLVIENDFKESKKRRKKDNDKTIVDCAKKINIKITHKKGNILYYNGLFDNPYDATNTFYHLNFTTEILDCLDAIRLDLKLISVILLLKDSDSESIIAFNKVLGTYPFISIKIMPNVYPIANKEILKDYIDLENNYLFNTIEIIELYEIMFNQRPLSERLITVTGNIQKPQVIKVKIGCSLEEIISEYYPNEKIENVLENHFLGFNTKKVQEVIINKDTSCILVINNNKNQTKPCISCGKCVEVCPKNCNPILNENMENCISCYLCDFICPSYINLGKKGG